MLVRFKNLLWAFIILLCLGTLSSAWAETAFDDSDELPSAPKNTAEFCQQLAITRAPKLSEEIREILKLKFSPEEFATPQVQILHPEQLGSTTNTTLPTQSAKIYLGASESTIQSDLELQQELIQLDAINKEITQSAIPIRRLYELAQSSWIDCVNEAEKIQFDINHYNALILKKTSLWRASSAAESKTLSASIPSSIQKSWKIQSDFTLGQLFRDLQKGRVENLVIISHADNQGRIFDAQGNTIPQSFFNHIHPRIRSISIFSCHGEKVRNYYQIDQALKATSNHERRLLITPIAGKFLNSSDVVPAETLGFFLKKVQSILLSESEKPTAQGIPTIDFRKGCTLKIEGVRTSDLAARSLGIFIDGTYVGTFSQSEIPFHCEIMLNMTPVVILRSLNEFKPIPIDADSSLKMSLSRSLQNSAALNLSTKLKRRPDGSIYLVIGQ